MKYFLPLITYIILSFASNAQSFPPPPALQSDTVHRKAGDSIYTRVEIESEYPGGAAAWKRYLEQNFEYPNAAIRKGIQGTVVVQFIVDKEGNVTDVEVVKSVHPLLDKEAVRLIKESRKWTPAVQEGKQVKSYKKQPIVFQLIEESPKKHG